VDYESFVASSDVSTKGIENSKLIKVMKLLANYIQDRVKSGLQWKAN
jgi:hypothetical protein